MPWKWKTESQITDSANDFVSHHSDNSQWIIKTDKTKQKKFYAPSACSVKRN